MSAEKIAILGLGYVGLPLAVSLARHFGDVVGFDIDPKRIESLNSGHDWTNEVPEAEVKATKARFAADASALIDRSFYIVTVPTPIDEAKRPDLKPLYGACRTLGEALKMHVGDVMPVIVFESTVYPGLTEDICGAELERISGKKRGRDFVLGYSPERINPGDSQNKLETIIKVIAAENEAARQRMDTVYGAVVKAGLHHAPSIAVAEAAKVLENTQRDLNIALMNELALICDRLDIRTHDVLAAAGTKWNFLKFTPGLVGGHCIGVDPYYLTTKAEMLGLNPQVILAGRRINDNMPQFVAQKLVKLMVQQGVFGKNARVGILGLTFKENVPDIRNSRVPDIVQELKQYDCTVLLHDPHADAVQVHHEYGLGLNEAADLQELDALLLAVPHKEILAQMPEWIKRVKSGGVIADIKSAIAPAAVPQPYRYWSL